MENPPHKAHSGADARPHIPVLIPALITYLGLSVRLDVLETEGSALNHFAVNLLGTFSGVQVTNLLLLAGLVLLFPLMQKYITQRDRKCWTVRLPAALFALFMVFGYSFETIGSWRLVMNLRHAGVFRAALAAAGYYCLFTHLLALAYHALDRVSAAPRTLSAPAGRRGIPGRYLSCLERYPFRTAFVTLLAGYLPRCVVSYPAVIMYDNIGQIIQAFPELKSSGIGYLTAERLLSPEVFLNQHHPVAHSMLIHLCLLAGDGLCQSFNLGLFLFALAQTLLCSAAMACGIAVLLRGRVIRPAYGLGVILYALFHPQIRNYVCLTTKDVPNTAFILLLLIGLYQWLSEERRGDTLILLSSAGMILFRNDSRFILPILFALTALLCRDRWRRAVKYTLLAVVFGALLTRVLFPALSITPGSRREMLSIPFQQTARYVRDHGDEVTEAERAAIDAVLQYELLAEKYDPNMADGVKNSFREEADSDALTAYFRVWLQMLQKHPGTYLQASMNNYHRYFYPDHTYFGIYGYNWSESRMERCNQYIQVLGQSISYPAWSATLRSGLDTVHSQLHSLPGVCLLMNAAVYDWTLILLVFYALRGKDRRTLALLMLPCAVLGMCCLGPCNGSYGRYTYPLVVTLPLLLPMAVHLTGQRSEAAKEKNNEV